MPTNKSSGSASASGRKHAKKKSLPPHPAMFYLHSPVYTNPTPSNQDYAAGEETMGEKPTVASTDRPSVMPTIESKSNNHLATAVDFCPPCMDSKPAAKKTAARSQKGANDSILCVEITTSAPKHLTQNPKNSHDFDSDDGRPATFPKAIKYPRNSTSAEATAKCMKEKEEAAKKDMGDEEPDDHKDTAVHTTKKRRGKRESVNKGLVKIKHTPQIPDDLPPRVLSSRRKIASAKALAAAGLESPPEETKSTRPCATRRSGLKSPPEDIEAAVVKEVVADVVTFRRSSRLRKSLPEKVESVHKPRALKTPISKSVAKTPAKGTTSKAPAKSASPKTPAATPAPKPSGGRRSKRKASTVAEELISTLIEAHESPEKETMEEDRTISHRSKRSRKPSTTAAEAKNNAELSVAFLAISSKTSPKQTGAKPAPPKCKAPTKREASDAQDEPPSKRNRNAAEFENKTSENWSNRIAMLKAHKDLYGDCNLTLAPKGTVPPLLQSFVFESRKQYKKFQKRQKSSMTAGRIDELEKLGFDFDPMASGKSKSNHDRRFALQWEENFAHIQKYKAEHGDCLVSTLNTGEYAKLGSWVRGQRKLLNRVGREGFNPERMAKLESIGFDFDPMRSGAYHAKKRASMFPRIEANWERHHQHLLAYKKDTGTITIGPNTEGYPGLYDWIHQQRKSYKKWQANDSRCLMHDSWIKKLNDLGFDWAPMKNDDFGKILLQKQRKRFAILWNQHYEDLKKYRTKHGHCYTLRNSDENKVLASWVHVQRKNKKKHDEGKNTPLTVERIKLLDDIDFDWAPAKTGGMQKRTQIRRDEEWEGVFAKLVSFKNKRGHACPKKVEPLLGSWACRMRMLYAQNRKGETTTLSAEKISKLESIGFSFARMRGADDCFD